MTAGHRNQAGLTLIELLATLAVMAVLTSIAAPAFHHLTARTRIATMQNAMMAGLHLARTEAVQGQTRTVMCPSRDGRHCRPGSDWSGGWLIAWDRDHDGTPDGPPIRTHAATAGHTVILGSRGRQRIHYHASGSAPGSNLTLTLCSDSPDTDGIGIVVSNSGRIRRAVPDATHLARCRRRALAQH